MQDQMFKMTASIEHLPESIILQMFEYLRPQEICLTIRRVCRHWNLLSYDQSLWSELDLRQFSWITDMDLVHIISGIGNGVRVLDISGCNKITDLSIDSQKTICPQLEMINVIGTKISEKGVSMLLTNIEKFPKLFSVQCMYTSWSPDCNFFQCLCDAYPYGRKIKSFHDPYIHPLFPSEVNSPYIQEGLLKLAALYNTLKEVYISQNAIEGIVIEVICKANPGITNLAVPGCLWLVDSLESAIGYLDNLLCLDISNTPTVDSSLVAISLLTPHLQKLNVTGCRRITDIGLSEACHSWKNLSSLVLNESQGTSGNITDIGMKTIAENCALLKDISACFCPSLSDVGIESIAEKCTLLESLDLTGCLAMTDKSVFALANNSKYLKILKLSELVQLTSASVNQLVLNCHSLQTLELETCHYVKNLRFEDVHNGGDNNIEGEEVSQDADACSTNIICQALQASQSRLRVLELGYCSNIATDSVKQIANYCRTLQNLSLRGCYLVTDAGIEAIATKCCLLQVLDLCASTTHHSKYTNKALHALAQHSTNLVMLNMQKVKGITVDGVKEIFRVETLMRFGVSGKAVPIGEVVSFCKEVRGQCRIDGMNVDYLNPNGKNEYMLKIPALRLSAT